MTEKKSKTNKKSQKLLGILGIGAAAAAALVFFYGTKKGEKERKRMKGWALMMKGEILKKMEKLRNLSEHSYQNIVDDTAKKFKKMKDVSASEVSALAGELKRHWAEIAKEAKLKNTAVGKKKSKK